MSYRVVPTGHATSVAGVCPGGRLTAGGAEQTGLPGRPCVCFLGVKQSVGRAIRLQAHVPCHRSRRRRQQPRNDATAETTADAAAAADGDYHAITPTGMNCFSDSE